MITENTSSVGRRRILAVILGLSMTCGCGGEVEKAEFARRDAKIEDIPPAVMEAAKKTLPGIKFDEAWRNVGPNDTLQSYEIRGRAENGKIREVRVSPEGAVLEME